MEDRLTKIKKIMLDAVPAVCSERARIVTRVYREKECLPIIEKRAESLAAVLREMSLYIEDGQLFVGNQASTPRAAPVYPEYAFDFILKEMDAFDKRESDRFVVTEENKRILREILPWWQGRTLKDRAMAIQPKEVLDDAKTGVLGWSGNITSGEGHYIPDYETVVRTGIPGMLDRINGLYEKLDLAVPEDLRKASFYRAGRIVLAGVIDYIRRFERLAAEEAEKCRDPGRKAELLAISGRCRALSERAPKTFAEALQCVWFIQVILHIETNGHSISMGRLDQYILPFYTRDIESGALTQEEAVELTGCFFLKVYGNNKLRSWSGSRTQLGMPTYQNICLGGQTPNGEDASNPFSYVCLEALGRNRLPEPNVYVRLYENTPEEFLRAAVKVVMLGFGIPAFVNDQVIIPSLLRVGVSKEDAFNYSTMGCTEVQVPGKWGYRANGKSKVNLLRILELVMDGGADKKTGRTVIAGIRPIEQCESFEEVYGAYQKALRYYMHLHVMADNINEHAMCELVPDALCSLLMQDCLERGLHIKEGGTVYDYISGVMVGIPNVGNGLYALQDIVFDKKLVTPAELRSALDANFEGKEGEYVQSLLLNAADKYGNDMDGVDFLTRDSSDIYTKEINNYRTMRKGLGPIGCCYTSSTVTITANISCGAAVGATPDGRKAGEPAADGVSPSRNTLKNGPTALLKSVSKLSNELFAGGQLLNIRINPKNVANESGEKRFVQYLRGFSELKCWHSQYNLISTETLRDAQRHPENYDDLVVRVAGYSARFTSLNNELQEDIIRRTEFEL